MELHTDDTKVAQNASIEAWNTIRDMIMQSGACACGYSPAGPVDTGEREIYDAWIKSGGNAGMAYMERYNDIRSDPRLLLDGARTVISIAFCYRQPQLRDPSLPYLASYAYGADYHDVIRERLRGVITEMKRLFGADSRICIDSAPIHERYWAERCGIGTICENGALAVPGFGSEIFIAEIVTTLGLPEPENSQNISEGERCDNCGVCRRVCPVEAIGEHGSIDSRRCLNYLTIEHRGAWDASQAAAIAKAGPVLMGCDRCLRACRLNSGKPSTTVFELLPVDEIISIDTERIAAMDRREFNRVFKRSAVKRARIDGIRRNLGLPPISE